MRPDDAASEPPSERPTRSDSLVPRPVLASEALKDEVAPIEPLARSARTLAAVVALAFGALAFAPRWAPAGKPWVEVASAIGMLALALAPLSYRGRAAGMLALGIVVGLVGTAGSGPASVLAYTLGEWGVLHLLAGVALPGALLFRGRYRAYPMARALLAAALGLCVPLGVTTALDFGGAPAAVQLTHAVTLAALATGLAGFVGARTPLSGGALATTILVALVADVIARAGARLGLEGPLEWGSACASAVAAGLALGVASVGAFQWLASRHWSRARSVDVHPPEPRAPNPSNPSLTDTWGDRR